MNIIVAADENWGIGNNNQLLVRIPRDMQLFREMTTGKVIVLGRKTLETFPQGMPLPSRTNIILSANPGFSVKGGIVVDSLDALREELKKYDSKDIYVVGGESVYRQLLPYCDTAHVTRVDHAYQADCFFPNLEKDPDWKMTADSDEQVYFDLTYEFVKYERKGALPL